jgi:nickel transport protein
MSRWTLSILALCLVAFPGKALAHGTDYRLLEDKQAIAAEFFYADQEPMRYAEVLVFSPGDGDVEYQNGRTDQQGRFAFCPDRSGTWQMKVSDGLGHAVQAKIVVGPAASGKGIEGLEGKEGSPAGKASLLINALFGLSILLNLALGAYIWKGSRSVTAG